MRFLNVNSPFMAFVHKLIDYMWIGILWVLFSIPVFSYGAATTAALLTMEISLHKEEGRILATFWKWFRKEFKEATLLWLIRVPICLLVAANIWVVFISQIPILLQVLIYIATSLVFCWSQLWFGYLSKFEDPIKSVLKNTFRMSMVHVGRVLLLGIFVVFYIAASVVLFLLMPPLLVFLPGSYLLAYFSVVNKIFALYIPKEKQCLEESLPNHNSVL